MKKKKQVTGKFYSDFEDYEISKTGKTIKVYDIIKCVKPKTYRIKDTGTEFARFVIECRNAVVNYYLADFIK